MLKQQNKSTTISDFYQGDNIFTQLNNSLFGQIKKIFEQNFLVLPKVIVIGTESSGKSSLLERITKCQLFPSDSKLCTKCPIKVKLQNGTASYSIQLPGDTIQQLENKKDIYPIVQNYMNLLSDDFISENEIIINITDFDVPDFEFYDLPGIRTYPHKVAKLSVNICKKYLSDKNSIVLCVVPCTTTRLTSCQSIALITEAKMEHSTILALTMTDRLKLENIEELLINRIIYKTDELNGIKFANCLAVVNRSQYSNYSLDESDEIEKKWFDKNIYQCIPEEYEEFREQIIQRTTISNVLKNMDNLFNHFIHTDWIPRMKNEMRSKEETIKKQIKQIKSLIPLKYLVGTTPCQPYKIFVSVRLCIPVDGGFELEYNMIGNYTKPLHNVNLWPERHANNEFILYKLQGITVDKTTNNNIGGDICKSIQVYETILSNFYNKIKIRYILKNNIHIRQSEKTNKKFDELFLKYIKYRFNENVLDIIKRNIINTLVYNTCMIGDPSRRDDMTVKIMSSTHGFHNIFDSMIGSENTVINDFIVQHLTIDYFEGTNKEILNLENELTNIQFNILELDKIK